jgi:glycolate oxidase iron-sulfur subunit
VLGTDRPPQSQNRPAIEDLSRCVHCGLCLPSCPTYQLTGMETESPRGRIHLIQALQEGRITATDAYASHIDRCLVCRACESSCPSGVPFGRIMESARADLETRRTRSHTERFARWLLFHKLLPHRGRLRTVARLLRDYQRSGLRTIVRSSGLLHKLPITVRSMEESMPNLPDRFFGEGRFYPALGARRQRVALFSGCVMPLAFARVHEATVRVLRRLGCEVLVPRHQVCCGALNVHAGERTTARALAHRNLDAFESLDVDFIVVNSAGCGSTLKEYGDLLAGDPRSRQRAERLAARVRDLSELIASLPFEQGLGPVRRRVTLQESCHLVHAQRVRDQPRQILGAIPGLELVELGHPDACCGSAGIYSFIQHEYSTAILQEKVDEIRQTAADVVVTSNPGCMLQLETGLRRAALDVEVRHLAEVLDWSYGSHR